MRYLLIFFIIYVIIRSVGKMLGTIKITDDKSETVSEGKGEPISRLKVSEDDIEDADFKEVD